MSDKNLIEMFGLIPPPVTPPQADYSRVGRTGQDMQASREWASRPNDERYTSLAELDDVLTERKANSTEVQIRTADIVPQTDGGKLLFQVPGFHDLVEPTNLGFTHLCNRIKAPADYLRRLPNELAAQCMQHGFDRAGLIDEEAIALITNGSAGPRLRAMTSVGYGRIWDSELSSAIRVLTEETNDWQVPIAFLRPGDHYNPVVAMNVTKEATTLYAGDRDMFLFLCDQTRPIVAGRLPDGSDRLFFRGFMTWNSEVGTRKLGVKTFLYQMCCQNRQIHSQAGVEAIAQRHTKAAPTKFAREIVPALKVYLEASATGIEAGLIAAQHAVIARDDTQRLTYLEQLLELGPNMSRHVLNTIEAEEGHPMTTVFDAAQGITAIARGIPNQDRRVEWESMAENLMKPFIAA
jgi:hypothetical protein